MPRIFFSLLLLFCCGAYSLYGQGRKGQALVDSLKGVLPRLREDSAKVKTLNIISYELRRINPDTGIYYSSRALALAGRIGWKKGEAEALRMSGINFYRLSEYSKALEAHLKAAGLFENIGDKRGQAANLNNIGNVYLALSDNKRALEQYEKALPINESIGNQQEVANNLNNIGNIYFNNSEYKQALIYYQKNLPVYETLGNQNLKALTLGNIGAVYERLSDYPKALENYQKAITIYEKLNDDSGLAVNYFNLGIVSRNLNDYSKSLSWHQKALAIWERIGNKAEQASNLNSLGSLYYDMKQYEKALEYLQKSYSIYEGLDHKEGQAAGLSNMAVIHESLGKYELAMADARKAYGLYESLGDKSGQGASLNNIGNISARQHDYSGAVGYQTRVVEHSREIGEVALETKAWESLSKIYETQGDFVKSYDAYKNYINLRDSIQGEDIKKQITRREIQYEFDKKESEYVFQQKLTEAQLQKQMLLAKQRSQELELSNKEKDLQRLAYLKEKAEKQEKEQQLTLSEKEKELQAAELTAMTRQSALQEESIRAKNRQRNLSIAASGLLLLALFFIYRNFSNQKKSNRLLSGEKQKSDNLLLNILPGEVAEELKERGAATARYFEEVTVLFTDFVNFTKITENLPPEDLVSEIDRCFRVFDQIIEKNGLEKIKTIGDAYLAVCGLPAPDKDHALKAVRAATEILEWIGHPDNKALFHIRIGLHSGPVVAGIVGMKKFAYDIWGDTVNTAARMEQNSEDGKINISGVTYELIKEEFSCVYRGKIEAKNKGAVDMYYLQDRKS